MALAVARILLDLPAKAGVAPILFPTDIAARHEASLSDFNARRPTPGAVAAAAELRALTGEKLAEAERRLKGAPSEILPAFIPLGALRLDLAALDRTGANPFEPPRAASPLRRQWAIWRWARGR
jgi:15-cis-phytoene synthase